MRRFGWFLLISAGLLLAASLAFAWLLGTPAGARALFTVLSRLTPIELRVEEVAGRLAGEVRLQGVSVQWPEGEARIGELFLAWHPRRLLAGEVAISELSVRGAEIELRPAEPSVEPRPGPSGLDLPRLRLLPFGLDGEIARLHLQDVLLHPPDQEAVALTQVEAGLAWRDQVLTVEDLRAETSLGTLTGRSRTDFAAPALQLAFVAEPADPPAGFDVIEGEANLGPAPGPRRMVGAVRVTATGGERLHGEGTLDWSADRLALESLRLTRPGHPGEVQGRLELSDPPEWRFAVALTAADIDLRPFTEFATDLAGELTATGRVDDYRGEIRVANRGKGWRAARLESPFDGGPQSLTLSALRGEWLGGRLQGRVAGTWGEIREITAELRGERLNPELITPEWPGRIRFDLQGAVRAPAQGEPLRAQIEARLRDSVLRGRALTGRLQADLAGEDLRIGELALHGDGFDLTAGGRLRERIDFAADIRRLSGLMPGAEGSIEASGWARWRGGTPAGTITARGREVVAGPVRVGAFELDAEHLGADTPFRVAADLQAFAYRDWQLATAAVRGAGTPERHQVRLTAVGPDLRLQGVAVGGYADGRWSGRVMELAGGGREFGSWELQGPTVLSFAAEAVRVDPFILAGEKGERLQGSADLRFEPLRGRLEAQWQRFDLSLANRWLPQGALDGRSTGTAKVRWLANDRLAIEGEVEADGTVILPEGRIGIRAATADLTWDAGGLRSGWRLALTDGGELTGEIVSEAPGRPGLPPHGEARAKWREFNLAVLSPWLPEMTEADGDSSGSVRGRWRDEGRRVELAGTVALAGRVAWRQLDLRIGKAAADFDWSERGLRGEWDIDLAERGTLQGRIDAAGPVRAGLPEAGEMDAEWHGFDLAILSPFLDEGEVAGSTDGRLHARWRPDRSLDLEGRVTLAGRIDHGEVRLDLRQAEAEVDWDRRGLRSRFELALQQGGRLTGTVTSPRPARLEVPENGRLEAQWQDFDLALLRPWMPGDILLEGSVAGNMAGEWLPGGAVRLAGTSEVRAGDLQWDSGEGVITAALRQAELSWTWEGEALRGEMAVALQGHGQARGTFQIPLPARVPTAIDRQGEVRGELTGTLQEEGLLTALMPGLVQETRGRLDFDLRASGVWEDPQLGGSLRLAEAGAYLPTAGLRLQDIALQGRLEGQQLRVESFQVRSGPGRLDGSGVLRLEQWRLHSYQAEVKGKDFQAVNLPELQLFVTPDLTVTGDRERLSVRGEVLLPRALVRGRETAAPVTPSPDVVIVDAPERVEPQSPLELDIQVRIVLGEHVLVKAEGIDARLEGSIRLHMQGMEADETTAQGEIRVAQGTYSTYGVRLKIERGVILFAGGPVDRPTLDILAMRTIRTRQVADRGATAEAGGATADVSEVKAGVRVTGTPRQPEVRLTSEPTFPDTDILAYIVLGHPIGRGEANTGLLMTAAGALLSKGESAALQDQLKRTLGLDVLEIEAGGGDVTGSQITIGKYLSPSLYISFGQSLFANAREVRLRYDISQKWQLESSVGNESAVDLYYKIEFR